MLQSLVRNPDVYLKCHDLINKKKQPVNQFLEENNFHKRTFFKILNFMTQFNSYWGFPSPTPIVLSSVSTGA